MIKAIEGRKVVEGLSEHKKEFAKYLREYANRIEAGEMCSGVLISVLVDPEDKENNLIDSYFCFEEKRYSLIGGVATMQARLTDILNHEG